MMCNGRKRSPLVARVWGIRIRDDSTLDPSPISTRNAKGTAAMDPALTRILVVDDEPQFR